MPGFVRGEEFGLSLFAIDFHGELVDVCAFGNGKDKRPFETGGIGIVEFLVDGCHSDLVVDVSVDLDVADFHGREHVRARLRTRPWGDRVWWNWLRRIGSRPPVGVVDDD